MKRLYDKNELTFALVWIGAYVVLLSLGDGLSARLGMEKLVTAPVGVILSVGLYLWLKKQGLTVRYGLCPMAAEPGQYLYFVPLAMLVSVNLWWGVTLRLTPTETVLYIISMLCVGFLEEVIFRGFLFRALCRDSVKQAVIISSVTFGVGHIVNLLNGADLVPTMLQICYAIAAGFLFTYIFYTGKSMWPCIIAHGVINSLSVFRGAQGELLAARIISAAFLCVVSAAYGAYLVKNVPADCET